MQQQGRQKDEGTRARAGITIALAGTHHHSPEETIEPLAIFDHHLSLFHCNSDLFVMCNASMRWPPNTTINQ